MHRHGGIEVASLPRMREVWVRSPVETETGYESSTAKRTTSDVSVTGARR